MRLVIGRGQYRRVYELPCAEIVRRASPSDQRTFVEGVCNLLGITR